MNVEQTFELAAKLRVHFIVQGEAVIATPASLVSENLRTAINLHRQLIRLSALTAHAAIINAKTAKEPNP